MYTYMHLIYICTYIRTYIRTCVHTYIHTNTCIVCVYTYTSFLTKNYQLEWQKYIFICCFTF